MATEQAASTEQGAHLERYVDQMRAAWADGQDPTLPERGRQLLETLLRETPADEAWMAALLSERPPARQLHRDAEHGFLQMGHFHMPGHGGTPHDHGPGWVLYGVYRGEIEITTYRRMDDGATPGQAKLEVKDVVRVTPGTVRPYLPGEIHSTRAIDPQGSVVMRFLSTDLDRVERYRYNLETGAVSRV
jgi:predicted metal-dependent enzyme (double-stranded beta helix superfamily)